MEESIETHTVSEFSMNNKCSIAKTWNEYRFRNIANYCEPILRHRTAKVEDAAPTAAALLPDAHAESLPEPASRILANWLESIAAQFAISRWASKVNFGNDVFEPLEVQPPPFEV